MFKRAHYVAMLAVLLLVLLLFSLPESTTERVRLAISTLFLPLFGLTQSTHTAAGKIGDTVVPRSVITRELEDKRRENSELRTQAMHYQEVMRENDRLHKILQWKQQVRWEMKLARVVGRDPANWWRMIHIDLGRDDGIKENATVLTPDGLVGRVGLLGSHRAQVILVGNEDCRVAALVDRTRENGVVGPLPSVAVLDPSLVQLSYLTRNTKLEPEQLVYTSGLGGVFPKGILVGRIVDSRRVEHGLYVEARLKLAVDLNKLEEVWVLATP